MIESLNGELLEKGADHVVIECGGVGYRVHLPAVSIEQLPKQGKCRVLVHYTVSVDVRSGSSDHRMYGFLNADERFLFRQLIEVQGVSATLGMAIMGARSAQDIHTAILTGNESALKGIKGIGPKLAQRIIAELQGRLAGVAMPVPAMMKSGAGNTLRSEALSALVSLGLDRSKAERALHTVLQGEKEPPALEELIRLSLKNL